MPENVIDQALEQVADRTPIDWDALESAVNSVDERRWLDCVKVLQDIAHFHFSTDDVIDPLAPGSDTTGPGPAAGAAATDRPAWWGRYRLDQKVGEGAFGCVYRAWDPELEREVAVKVLHKRVSEARLKEGLLREGRALARVRHPNVVSVLSVESHEDQIALCMEFVHGETLADGLARGPLSAREATLVCQDICRALAAVHLAGFVHRDVKARNVMREKAGRIVLMDFGAGQHASQLEGIGRNRVVGTPLYMAPEILDGEPASATSDVYSAGVLLYHLVTSEYPVEGQTLDEIRAAHMQGRRRLLSERRPELPVTFLQVVDKALAADPGRRYGSAALFLEALVAVADEVKVEPRSKSSTLVRILSTVVAVFLAAVAVGFILSLAVNHAFGRSEFIAETPLDWLIWGLRSWLGTVITLLVIGLGASALLVVRQLTMSVSSRARELEASLCAGREERRAVGAAERPDHRRIHRGAACGPVADRRLLVLLVVPRNADERFRNSAVRCARIAVSGQPSVPRAVSQELHRDHDVLGPGLVCDLAACAHEARCDGRRDLCRRGRRVPAVADLSQPAVPGHL